MAYLPDSRSRNFGIPTTSLWKISILIAIGSLARLALSVCSIGSNDAITWANLGVYVRSYGVFDAYRNLTEANHPPLPLLWSALSIALTRHVGLQPWFWMKIPGIFGDAITTFFIFRFARRRPLISAGLFALNPVMVLVAGYHCNTDTLCADLCLLAALAFDGSLPFVAGSALAAAINVKLIPVMLILPLALLCNRREFQRYILGLSLGILPFIPVLLNAGHGFFLHALSYNSNLENWGLILFASAAMGDPHLHKLASNFMQVYRDSGRDIVLLLTALCGVTGRLRLWDASRTFTAVFAVFLIVTPGFGIQYLVYVIPALAVTSLDFSLAYAVVAGAFALAVYSTFSDWTFPLQSRFSNFPPFPSLLGILSWSVLVYLVITELRRRSMPASVQNARTISPAAAPPPSAVPAKP